MAPDPDSRTKTNEGRRIKEIDGGWVLLNHGKYRSIRDDEERRAYKAGKEREYRAKKKEVERGKTRGQNGQTWTGVDSGGHNAEADTEAESTKTHPLPPKVHDGAAEPPSPESEPSGVRPPRHRGLTATDRNLVDLVLLGSPPGVVAGLTSGMITPAHRVPVIEAAKREAHEHDISVGEALDGLRLAVESQASATPPDRLRFFGDFGKYFTESKYRIDPIHTQERTNGKRTGTINAVREILAKDKSRASASGVGGAGSAAWLLGVATRRD
jgi:hypothetical protein